MKRLLVPAALAASLAGCATANESGAGLPQAPSR